MLMCQSAGECRNVAVYFVEIPGPHAAKTPMCEKCLLRRQELLANARPICFVCGCEGVSMHRPALRDLQAEKSQRHGFQQFRAGPMYGACKDPEHVKLVEFATHITRSDRRLTLEEVPKEWPNREAFYK